MMVAAKQPELEVVQGGGAKASPTRYKPDDDDLAIELARDLVSKVAFFHQGWKVYEDGAWAARDAAEVRRYIRQSLRGWRDRGVAVSQQRIRALCAMLEDDLFVSDRKVLAAADERKRYVNLRNGLFNLESFTLEPHRPDLYFTTQLDFDYDPDADCPAFRQYLNTSLVHPNSTAPDWTLINLVLEALGYSMTARTDLKASFWLVGEKDSGKSTFAALLKALMGDLHGTIDLTQLGGNRFLLAGVVGKRTVSFTEASGSAMLPDALYKALVGGSDEIYADVKNRNAIVFRPECKVWWAMNEKPRINDRSGATTRRIIIIPFNRSIPEGERVSNLEARLYRERAGIFSWCMDYYQGMVRRGGWTWCAQSAAKLAEYVEENDTEATYAAECLAFAEISRVRSSELYASYSGWCATYGFRPKNYNQIATEWRRLGLRQLKSDGVIWWVGASLRS